LAHDFCELSHQISLTIECVKLHKPVTLHCTSCGVCYISSTTCGRRKASFGHLRKLSPSCETSQLECLGQTTK